MPEHDDQEMQGIVFGLLGAVVLGVLLLVGGLGLWKGSAGPAAGVLSSDSESNLAPVGEPLARLAFERGQPGSPELGGDIAARVKARLALDSHAIVLVSAFQGSGGDPEAERNLARQRATAIRNQLVRSGVAARRILLRQPEMSLATTPQGAPEYVEVRVQ